MRIPVAVFVAVSAVCCVGCRTTMEVQTEAQAIERATVLRSECAGYTKDADAVEKQVADLKEDIELCRRRLRTYEEKARLHEEEIAELKERAKLSGGSALKAVQQRLQRVQKQKEAMVIGRDQEKMAITDLEGTIRSQQQYLEDLLYRRGKALREAEQLEAFALELSSE